MSSAASIRADMACERAPPRRATSRAPAISAARTTDGEAPVSRTYEVTALIAGDGRQPSARRQPGKRSRCAAAIAATMAMFQPEIATTCVRPARAKASLIAGSMPARTPSRMPAASAASGSGTSRFRPESSHERTPCRASATGPSSWPITPPRGWRRWPPRPAVRGRRDRRSPRSLRAPRAKKDLQPVAGPHHRAARQPEQDRPVSRRFSTRADHLHPVDDNLLPLSARPRVVDSDPGERPLLRTRPGGDAARADWQGDGRTTPSTKRHAGNRIPATKGGATADSSPAIATARAARRQRPQVHPRR